MPTATHSDVPTVTIERTFKAPIEKVWAMWTTKEGLEKWYWPEPLVGKVKHLDVRVGGGYEITAEGLAHSSRGTYTDVMPCERLGIRAAIDFLPDTAPYERIDSILLQAVPAGTKMTFTCTQMHSAHWQKLAMAGWTSSLDKLARALEVSS